MSIALERETIAIVLATFIPGLGHIYLGRGHRKKGVVILLLAIMSGTGFIMLLNYFIHPFLQSMGLYETEQIREIVFSLIDIILIVPFIAVWIYQISDLMKFVDNPIRRSAL